VVPAREGPELTPGDAIDLDSRQATVRSTAMMSGGTLLSRGTGLIRVVVTLWALGAAVVSDAYNTANTTPNIVYELVLGGILTSVFVPILVARAKEDGPQARFDAAQRFLTIALVILGAVAVIGILIAPWIMRLYLSNVADPVRRQQETELGTFFLRWFMPQVVFYGLGAVAIGVLTTHRRFAAQMYAPILNNLVVIATICIFVAIHGGALSPSATTLTFAEKTLLGAGTTLGIVVMTVALWPALRRIGFRWRFRWDWRHDSVRRLLHLGRWVVVYVIANQIAYLIIINLASTVSAGAYTIYSQSFIFFSLPHAIVAVSIFTALLPGLTERWHASDADTFRELFSRGFRDTMIAMVPAAAGYIVLALPIASLLAHGAVQSSDVPVIARTLAAFAVGLPFFSAFQLLTRTLYATGDSRTPAVVNIGVGTVNVAVDLLVIYAFHRGVAGLALGHAASYVFGSIVLFAIVRRRLGGADDRRIGVTLAKTLVAAAATAVAAAGVATIVAALLDVDRVFGRLIQVSAGVAAGMLVFLVCARIVRLQEVDEVKDALLAGLRRRR
jgi:putative peptidoglycan lipid II flippase